MNKDEISSCFLFNFIAFLHHQTQKAEEGVGYTYTVYCTEVLILFLFQISQAQKKNDSCLHIEIEIPRI
jgi:hypothetical protein